jgi:sugar (pentulose or hexulose) kinase
MRGGPLFVAIDVGTTGARASAIDLEGQLRHEARRPYPTSIPRPGWAEQDPRAWRESALDALAELIASPSLAGETVGAVGLTGQCPTIAPCDAAREPVGPGLLYRDNRATAQAAEMRRALGDQEMHARTGAVASAFHAGPKVLWLREHDPCTFAAADRFMQPRDVVLHALTGVTATDETHANSTLFFDLRARDWAEDFLDCFSLHSGLFPDVAPSWSQIGTVDDRAAARTGVPAGCPVVLGAADSQCAAFGSDVLAPGPISEMAGASSCLNSVIYEPSPDPRITHYSYLVPDCYCTELGVNVSGGALRWAVDQFRLHGFDELETGAQNVHAALGSPRVGDPRLVAPLFLPYLGDGERDDAALRAAFIGLSDRHGHDELSYAVLEGLAFAVTETVSVLTAAGPPLQELRVAGGGARLSALGELKADALGAPVIHLAHDSASVGVGLLAASATGFAKQATEALAANLERGQRFEPSIDSSQAVRERYRWFTDVRGSSAVRLQT